jgi:hypothetical protein
MRANARLQARRAPVRGLSAALERRVEGARRAARKAAVRPSSPVLSVPKS